jgi:chromatin segregation and condensation protein Rec8/ScpA/Scc1 (kleisin family)
MFAVGVASDARQDSIYLQDLIEDTGVNQRHDAAEKFMFVLQLVGKGRIRVVQPKEFGDIEIKFRPVVSA